MYDGPEYDYTYRFSGISDQLQNGRLEIHDHRNGRTFNIRVAVDDQDFLHLRGLRVESRIADLIDLAVAIYEADRWSKRVEKRPTVLRVVLPVRNTEILQSEQVLYLLKRILFWYTGDLWQFEFQELTSQCRYAELQRPLWKSSNEGVVAEVALWSGGLDAFAGLCNRIEQRAAERFLLFGAGGNQRVKGVQKDVFQLMSRHYTTDLGLMQLPIYQRDTKQKGLRRDDALRARGLVFVLLGSAYAKLEGQHQLHLYENGIGAINLPFRASEVGLDHARAVHPISLQNISRLLALIFDEPFSVLNPFLFWTKGEMCRILAHHEIVDIAWMTESCDRARRNVVSQCGCCSSCILRRLSFLAAGIPDRTHYLTDFETGNLPRNLLLSSHLPHMRYQVTRLREWLSKDNAWEILARQHPSLLADLVHRSSGAPDQAAWIELVLSLLSRYTDEWMLPAVKQEFEPELEIIKRLY